MGANVEVAWDLICVKITMNPAALAALLPPQFVFPHVYAKHGHVQRWAIAQRERPAAETVQVVLKAHHPARLALAVPLFAHSCPGRGSRLLALARRQRGVARRRARPGPGGEAVPLASAVPACADPALGNTILAAPSPPMARGHRGANPGTKFHAVALELVSLRAVVVPATLLCAVGCEVHHQGLANVIAMDDDVPLHAVWPW
mmetsp:Transcript_100131/g.322944  ORF Transcript_100131/g.322944 Transcript_100131/m.322944 type:complete len:203 (-) Transcript_100131:972-1580(-)